MNRLWIRRLAVATFSLNLLAITWPVVTVFRYPEPFFLGLPLSMAWPIAWILIGWITLPLLDHFESKDEAD